MTLKELLLHTDPFQDIQLINAKNGICYTDVTYQAGGSPDNLAAIYEHLEDKVYGIAAEQAKDGNPYLVITIDTVI